MENRCNLKCDYCYIGLKSRQNIPADKMQGIFQAAEGLGLLEAYLVGSEPTLHPELERILRDTHILEKTGSTMITNGTTMTPEMVKLIRDSNLNRIAITIDGPDPESHNSRRGKNFMEVWRGLELLQETGKSITVISIAHHENKDSLIRLSEVLAKGKLAAQHHIVAVSKSGFAVSKFDEMKLNPNDFERIQAEVDSNHDTLARQGLDLVFATYWQGTGKRSELRSSREITMFELKEQLNDINIVVTVEGDVKLTSASWHREFQQEGVVGNILNEKPVDLFKRAGLIYEGGDASQLPRDLQAQSRYAISDKASVKVGLIPTMSIDQFDLLNQSLGKKQLKIISDKLRSHPTRYRTVCASPGFFVLFDKQLSMVTLLREDEVNLLESMTR